MKKTFLLFLCVLFAISMCSCSSSENGTSRTYTVNKYGTDYVVDPDNGTISDGTHIYQYELSGNSSGYSIHITYPDGSSYWWNMHKSGSLMTGEGGWSDNYEENRYVDGRILCDVLEEDVPKERNSKNILFVLVLLIFGIFNTVSPHTAWYLEYGWRYKNAEPSDAALVLNRLGGIAAIIVAVIIIFV